MNFRGQRSAGMVGFKPEGGRHWGREQGVRVGGRPGQTAEKAESPDGGTYTVIVSAQ
jgi:hypothetical protein